MFVLTFVNPDDAEVTVLYTSLSENKLQSLIEEFNKQVANLSFEDCPNEITFGDICLEKDPFMNYTYSYNKTVFIPYDACFDIHKVPVL